REESRRGNCDLSAGGPGAGKGFVTERQRNSSPALSLWHGHFCPLFVIVEYLRLPRTCLAGFSARQGGDFDFDMGSQIPHPVGERATRVGHPGLVFWGSEVNELQFSPHAEPANKRTNRTTIS